jgi:leucyl/phenylalanyl-tRNA--protein transferase
MVFPHPSLAEPGGLLAIGGDLSPQRLLLAYRNGIFPWFGDEGYYYWYAPDPRFVLFPGELVVHKSMRNVFNRGMFTVTFDRCFAEVMQACAETPREGQDGSWISEDFIEAYTELHRMGVAHSVEVWHEGALAGGLYGLALGKIFYGESMFARMSNASKVGFITLVRALEKAQFKLIDCQQETAHLASLGARGIPRELFLEYLNQNVYEKTAIGHWRLTEAGEIRVEVQSAEPERQ